MRLLTLILLLLLGGLQYDLWLGKNGLSDYRELSTAIERQQQDNLVLKDRNSLIYREIDDLTSGLEAIEEVRRQVAGAGAFALIKGAALAVLVLPHADGRLWLISLLHPQAVLDILRRSQG